MLYLHEPAKVPSTETQHALNAADGYMFFSLLDEALAELERIPKKEQKEPPVMLAQVRLLLHKKEWRKAEWVSAEATGLHPGEGEFFVQRAFALHQLDRCEKAEQVLMAAPDWIRRTGILHYNLACYEARLGNITTARKCIDEAIEINAGIKKSAKVDPDLQVLWS